MFKWVKQPLGITEEDKQEDKKVSVPFMVTRDMKQQLLNFGYPRSIVDTMEPAKAWLTIKARRTYNVR